MPSRTQTDRDQPPNPVRGRWWWLTGPTALAVIVTLANAVKPVLVDDTAYLAYARHIADHPLDPYGFRVFWYDTPDDAMEVLCPPVLPYWLALGIRLFGEHVVVLKLWLFPFVWLFAASLSHLLRRFARGTERVALPLVVLSPAVLPVVNFMLDIPAAALGLAALALFARAADRQSWRLAAAAGLVAALAIQTKYTALIVPAVIGWYGLTHRRVLIAVVAVAVTVAAFAGWEWALQQKYGRSHFLYHASQQQQGEDDGSGRLAAYLDDKLTLLRPLLAHLGCLAVGVGLYAGRAVGFPRWVLLGSAVCGAAGVGLVAGLPHSKLTLAAGVWRAAGAATLVTAAAGAALLLVRFRKRRLIRWNAASAFVVGWVVLEVAGYFALTPFPAARRVIGVTVALGVLAARVVSRVNRASHRRRPPAWVVPFGVTVGVLVAALDTFDAYPEKVLAERAAAVVPADARGWYFGHWGFQYYCERAGLRPAIAGQTELRPGDYLVAPVIPDGDRFYRPASDLVPAPPPGDAAEPVAEFVWDDPLPAQTIPNFYGDREPVVGRDRPRLRVVVFRVVRPWVVGGE